MLEGRIEAVHGCLAAALAFEVRHGEPGVVDAQQEPPEAKLICHLGRVLRKVAMWTRELCGLWKPDVHVAAGWADTATVHNALGWAGLGWAGLGWAGRLAGAAGELSHAASTPARSQPRLAATRPVRRSPGT
jgi:hypothetical protein